MISTQNLKKLYATEEVETTALNDVTMAVDQGEFVAVMGPSGCGKSTLLNILGLLDNPTGGEYHFLDEEVSGHSERQRANLRKANIGFVFQSFNLIDELTVYENIELPLIYLGTSKTERKERVDAAMEHMQIPHRRNHFPQQLSGGQQQRVAVAQGGHRQSQADPGGRAYGKPGFGQWRGGDGPAERPQRSGNDHHHGDARPDAGRPRPPDHPAFRRSYRGGSRGGRSGPGELDPAFYLVVSQSQKPVVSCFESVSRISRDIYSVGIRFSIWLPRHAL